MSYDEAMTAHGFDAAQISRSRDAFRNLLVEVLPNDMLKLADVDALYKKIGRFEEGSLPVGDDPRAKVLDIVLKRMFGLDPRTTFRGDMDGAVRSGGGIMPVFWQDNVLKVILGEDGEKFHKGKKKILGGQLCDADRGDTWKCAVREVSEEGVEGYTFVRERAWKLHSPVAWRNTDGRMEYPISGDFFVYPVDEGELADIRKVFATHTAKRGGKGEIVQIHAYTADELYALVRGGEIAFPEGCEAFLLLAMVMDELANPRVLLQVRGDAPFVDWAIALEFVRARFRKLMDEVAGDYSKLPEQMP